MTLSSMLRATCLTAFGLLLAACAQQPQPAPMSGMSSMPGMNMRGMKTHDMAGMAMQTMMNHCVQMHQEVSQGKQLAPDMQSMMAECDQMDRSMPASAASTDAPAPAATRSR